MVDNQTSSAVVEQLDSPTGKPSPTEPANIQSLTEAFDIFNQKTRKLQASYKNLKKQVDSVNEELRQKNEILKCKIGELDMTRDYLKNILESMSNGLIAVNLGGTITTFNKAAETITGFARHEVLGKLYSSVFPDDSCGRSPLDLVIKQPNSRFHKELTMSTRDGRSIPVGVSISPVRDSDNRIIGAIKIFDDLTEIKELERQARRADRLAALGEMAASVAHEIRNPLGGIEGFAALLERDLSADEPKRDMAHNIVQGARSLNRIVTSLLDFTRPVRPNMELIRIEEVIENAVSLVAEKPGQKMDTLIIERRFNAQGSLRTDRQLMLQVFMNLILNAVQAMDGVGVLTLETERENGAYHIRIGDTGCGIPEELREKLFMPFVTTKKEGTGLGLSTVMKIVTAQNGSVTFETRPREGTVFDITLPAIITEQE